MRVLFALTLAVALSGCGMLYRQSVQQGNLLEDDQVDALKPGMTKRQVSLVLGTAAIMSPFHENRWDYVSSYKDAEGTVDLKRLTVIFENDVLVRIEGDYEPGKGVKAEGTEPESPKLEDDDKAKS